MQLPDEIIKDILKDRELYSLSWPQMAKALYFRSGLKISGVGLKKKLYKDGYLQ